MTSTTVDQAQVGAEESTRSQVKWHANPVITAIIGSVLTALFSFSIMLLSRTIDNGNNITGDSVKITNLQNSMEVMQTQISGMESKFVSQSQFAEFKNRYEQDQMKLLSNDARIENKLDILLMEHAKSPSKAKIPQSSMNNGTFGMLENQPQFAGSVR